MQTLLNLLSCDKGNKRVIGLFFFFKHRHFVLEHMLFFFSTFHRIYCYVLRHAVLLLWPSSSMDSHVPNETAVLTWKLKCDKEASTSAVRCRAPDTGAIISIRRNTPICKTLAQHPFISVHFVYLLVPFPLCCLVCLPLECWQTVDAPCCGDAESVGVDGQDYATQRSTFLLPHI